MKNNFIRLTLLASLFCNAPGLHLQAQAPYPEAIYLCRNQYSQYRDMGLSLLKRTKQRQMEKERSSLQLGNCKDLENILTDDGIPSKVPNQVMKQVFIATNSRLPNHGAASG